MERDAVRGSKRRPNAAQARETPQEKTDRSKELRSVVIQIKIGKSQS